MTRTLAEMDRNHRTTASPRSPRVIGLVGAIGGGKSTVAKRLEERGAVVINADKIGHEVLQRPEIRERLVEAFGAAILDGSGNVDRKRLAAIVFTDPDCRRRLEAVVHPAIRETSRQRIAEAQRGAQTPLIVLDAAVLLEAGWHDVCDAIVFVNAPRDERVRRLAQSRGWTQEELTRREDAQSPLTEKLALADVVIDNDSSLDQCRAKADQWFERWARSPISTNHGVTK